MCGISGIYQKDGDKNLKDSILKLNNLERRRGPDDEGFYIDPEGRLGLGHTRLSILDLSSAGHQPMARQLVNSKEQIVITFNGEIYNFLELKKELTAKGYHFKTRSDTEVILALYSEYGANSFLKLRGMFAFGLWDSNLKKLFLVRDRYGIKPLYYRSDANRLIFASSVKALEKGGLFKIEKNPKAILGFLIFGSVPNPITTIKGVVALEAGRYLERSESGEEKIIRYYDPLPEFFNKKNKNISEIAEDVRRLLEESANLHLLSDAPLGVFLSGGVDSSVIALLSAQKRQMAITTLSIDFKESEYSERKYQDLIVGRIKSNHERVEIEKQDFFNQLPDIFEAMDQPTIDGVNTFLISLAAKKSGLKTVLSGLGSDEIFAGYPFFKRAKLLRKIQQLPKTIRQVFGIASGLSRRYARLDYYKKEDILSFYLSLRGLFSLEEAANILGVNQTEVDNFFEEVLRDRLSDDRLLKLQPADLLMFLEMEFYLRNQLLKDTDFMSMYHSVEVRVPFLDYPLVQYLSGLHPEMRMNKNLNKPLLVESMRDLLPSEIFSRPKMGFTFPFEKWLKDLPDALNGDSHTLGDVFNDYRSGKIHWSRFWALTVLNQF